MKRTIKFKAWSKKLGRFVYPDKMEHNINFGISSSIIYFDQITGQFGEEECELVQFTGIKDKNGKEVYEGDIVELWGGEQHQGYWEVSVKGQVVFSYNSFLVRDSKDVHFDPSLFDCNIQIIGNLYETPELLNN